MNTRMIFTHALSPLHAGTGQGVGVIDLPIAREKATGIPFLPGSSLKGTLRDSYLSKCADDEQCKQKGYKVFGPKTDEAEAYAGAAQFADQRLLLLPIRSLAGTFAWVTSPYLLQRFVRDAENAGVAKLPIPTVADDGCCVVQPYTQAGKNVACKLKVKVGSADKVVLEDLDLTPTENPQTSAWAKAIASFVFRNDPEWQQMLGERFCIVSDDALSFLLNTATEITARIKLQDDVKTVQKGGLWYEEALPTETVLYGLLIATPNKETKLNETQIFQIVAGAIPISLQLGGKATVGRGLCRVVLQDLQNTANQQPSASPPETSGTDAPTPEAEDQATPTKSPAPKLSIGTAPVLKPQSS